MTYRRRGFPEVLQRLLTSLVGGVAGERHPFPPPGGEEGPVRTVLEDATGAAEVVGVWGRREGDSFRFEQGADFELAEEGRALVWRENGRTPDAGSVVEVTYRPKSAESEVDDLVPGGVARTLLETVAREIAGLHARLREVYRAGFLATASGSALDRVVDLLDVERVRGGRPAGEVEFRRAEGTAGRIEVPAGTRVATGDGEGEYETTESTSLLPGQRTVRVRARDLEPGDPLPAESLTVMPVPIAGIASVTNPAPTRRRARDESDEELRTRARNVLHGSERATLGALVEAVRRQGIDAEVGEDPERAGHVRVIPREDALTPEEHQRLVGALERVRPAGVRVTVEGARPPVRIEAALRVTSSSSLPDEDLRAAHAALGERMAGYVDSVPAGDPISLTRLAGEALRVEGIEDVRVVDVIRPDTGASVLDREAGTVEVAAEDGDAGASERVVLDGVQVSDPNLPTRLEATVVHLPDVDPPDEAAIRSSLDGAVGAVNRWSDRGGEEAGRRPLGYRELLLAVPLPGAPAGDLAAHLRDGDDPPALPDPADRPGYRVRFVLTGPAGVSRVLASPGDAYRTVPGERFTLEGVELHEEAGDG